MTDCLTICMLASGSKGNSVYISNGTTTILVDAGLSGIKIEKRLKTRGLRPEDIDAILVTHEHGDHIHGVGVLSRRYDLPVYISPQTNESASSQLGTLNKINYFECGKSISVNDLTVHPFSISHDAKDPAGFTIQYNGCKVGIATDLGITTGMVREHLKGCTALILEANHDPQMLEEGPYPWPLKQRVKSRIGHLSNEDAKNLLIEVRHDGLSEVVLAHLSQQNNTPEKALSMVGQAINLSGVRLTVAEQDVCGELITLNSVRP